MSEHAEQVSLFKWAALMRKKYPELALMYAVPNGGHRHVNVARKLSAEGVKAGVPDIHLPVAAGRFIGLWIEMKFGTNRPSEHQARYMEALRKAGHRTVVCYSWASAVAAIEEYLSMPRQVAA